MACQDRDLNESILGGTHCFHTIYMELNESEESVFGNSYLILVFVKTIKQRTKDL